MNSEGTIALANLLSRLRDDGAIALDVVESRMLFFIKTQSIVVNLGPEPAAGAGTELYALARAEPGSSVVELFRRWLTRDVADPEAWVVDRIGGEAITIDETDPFTASLLDACAAAIASRESG